MATLCLCMIVKNESHIITRLFDSVISIIDSYCICDTNSTDNTVEIIQNYFNGKNNLKKIVPGNIFTEPFKNFAHNRNFILNKCTEINSESDYILLLDADMVLQISNTFDKNNLLSLDFEEYNILQGNDAFHYYNTRIIKNNNIYKYVGVTHEFLLKKNNLSPNKTVNVTRELLFIDDIGDGGSKTDKFIRDISLLKQGIIEEPNNLRYYFYLGNSYYDLAQNEDAIITYKQFLSMNASSQEKYVACIRIYESYGRLNKEEDGIQYLIQSHSFEKNRIEGIYRLVKYYFNKEMYDIAYSFYSLIQDFFENQFLNQIDLVNINLFNYIYEYKFYLPYYMSIIGNKLKNNELCEKMYNIIFLSKCIDVELEYLNNLIDNYNSANIKDKKTIENGNIYIKLLQKKNIHGVVLNNEEPQLKEVADNLVIDEISNSMLALAPLAPSAPIIPPAHTHNKIILTLMIKNESKIIERCISNVIDLVDAISILDTGSTDNTVEVCTDILTKYKKPFKITTEEFKNFGYNRSISFDRTKEFCKELNWNMKNTYSMAIDADMVICASPAFKNFKLTQNGYTIIQKNNSIKYYNVRFMQIEYNWKCIGATHEYWSGDPTEQISEDIIYIDDISDGGCKSDKVERDIRLLNEDIDDGKNVDRAHFYLAQTLKDIGKHEDAIEKYKKRIELGGWFEEVWYSHYQIGKCYYELKKYIDMEYWMNKAFEYNNNRSEPLYFLTYHYRMVSQHYKAYHYYLKGKNIPFPKNDLLFIEHNVYNGLFDYENTILLCYLIKKRQDALCELISYINKNIPYSIHNVWDNIHYYIETLRSDTYKGIYTSYQFSDYFEPHEISFTPSSCALLAVSPSNKLSICPDTSAYLLNLRLVNYSIDKMGGYHMKHPNKKVVTKNSFIFLDKNYKRIGYVGYPEILSENCIFYDNNIEGLEDIRIFYFKNEIYMTASSKNVTNNDNIDIVLGKYCIINKNITNITPIKSPNNSSCEKNWIYVPELAISNISDDSLKDKMHFIYGWHPLEIGSIDENNELKIHTKYNTPSIFSRFRGSSNIVHYNHQFYTVIHFVKYTTPRVYYHAVVIFDKSMRPIKYSAPFCFCQNKI